MKKLLCVCCSIALLLSLASCGGTNRDSAEKVTEDAIKACQSGDQTKIQEYWGTNSSDSVGTEDNPQAQEMAKIISKYLTYKITGSEENKNDGTATVSVEFTNINMSEVFASYIGELFSVALEYAFMPEDQQPSEEEMNQIYMDKFMEIVEENKDNTVTNAVDISLTLVNDEWEIDATEETLDAILGGLYSSASSMSEAFGE